MATIHPFPPPRRAGLYDPLRSGAEPGDYLPADLIRRRVADEAVDLFDAREKAVLAEAGYRWGIRDDLDEMLCEFRASPASHALAFIAGAFVALASLIIFLAGWLS
jgi:hypothetical protein